MAGNNGGSIIVRLELLTKGFTSDFDSAANTVVKKSQQMERQLAQLDQKMGNFGKNFGRNIEQSLNSIGANTFNNLQSGFDATAKKIERRAKQMTDNIKSLMNGSFASSVAGLKGQSGFSQINKMAADFERITGTTYRGAAGFQNLVGQMDNFVKEGGKASYSATQLGDRFKNLSGMNYQTATGFQNLFQKMDQFSKAGGTARSGLSLMDEQFKKTTGMTYQQAAGFNRLFGEMDKYTKSGGTARSVTQGLQSNLNNLFNKMDGYAVSGGKVSKMITNQAGAFRNLTGMTYQQSAGFNRLFNSMDQMEGVARKNGSAIKTLNTSLGEMGSSFVTARSGYRALESEMVSGTSRIGNSFATVPTRFQSAIAAMQNSGHAGISAIGNTLNALNSSARFTGMVNGFKGGIDAMVSSAKAGASQIKKNLTEGLSATDYMATIFGGMFGQQIWNKGYGKATMLTQLGNRYAPTQANQYLQGYQGYTVKSSTSDEQITNLMKYVTQSGIKSNQTYKALNAMDAAATIADPTQRQELLRNFGMYMTQGYSEALFRGDVTPQEAQILKSAQTPEQRIQAMETLAKGRGNLDSFGNALSTTTSGPLGGFNAAMAAMDNLIRAMTNAFMGFMQQVKPLFTWFNSLNQSTQDAIGKYTLLFGILMIGGSVIGIILNLLAPMWAIFTSMLIPLASWITGLNGATISALGFSGTLDYMVGSLIAEQSGMTLAQVSHYGYVTSIAAAITGIEAETIARYGLLTSIVANVTGFDVETVSLYGNLTALYARLTGTDLATMGNMGLSASLGAVAGALVTSTAATVSSTIATVGQTISRYGLLTSIIANITGFDVETVSLYGNTTALYARLIGTDLSTIGNLGMSASLGTLIGALSLSTIATYAQAAAFAVLDFVMSANPITLIVIAIVGLIAVVAILITYFGSWGAACSALNGAWNGIVSGVTAVWNALTGFYNWIKGGIMDSFFKGGQWQGIVPGLQNLFGKIWNFVSNINWSALGQAIWKGITGIFSSSKSGGLGLTDWLLGAIKNSFVAVAQFIANYNLITIIVTLLFGSAAGKQVSDATYNALKGIADAFLWLAGAIGNTIAFFQAIPSMLTWENLGKGLGDALGWIMGALANTILWIEQLPGRIYIAFVNMGNWIIGAWNNTIAFFTALPGRIYNALVGMGNWIRGAFTNSINWIIGAWNNTVAWFTALPGRIGAALSGIGSWIMGAFGNTIKFFSDAWKKITDGFNNSSFGAGFARLASAVQPLWDALRKIVCIILGCSPGIVPALQQLYGSFTSIMGGIWSAVSPIVNMITGAFRFMISIFQSIGSVFKSAFEVLMTGNVGGAIQTLFSGLSTIGTFVINAIRNIDWMGVFSTIVSFIAQYNPVTLIIGAIFGQQAGNQAASNVFTNLMNIIGILMSYFTAFGNIVRSVMSGIWTAISPVVNMITGAFQFMISIFQSVGTVVRAAFGQLMSGNIGGAIGTLFSGLSTIGGFVLNALMNIDWMGIFQTIGSSVRGVVSILWSAIFGGDGGNSIFTTLWNTLSSIDWSGILMNLFAQLATLFAQYNPLTLLVSALFGPQAGGQLQVTIFTTLMQVATAFVNGLNIVWGVLTTMATYASSIWNGMVSVARIAWGLIQSVISNPIRAVYSVAVSVFGAVRSFVVGVWNSMRASASSTFNLIKSAITTPFNTAKSILTSIWNSLKSGWNGAVSTLVSAGNRLKSSIMGPIRTVYNGLVDLWNLVTGNSKGHMSGSTGAAGTKGSAGYAGPSMGVSGRTKPGTKSSGGITLGPLTGIGNAVAGFINKTANLNGLPGRFAGPSAGLGDGPGEKDSCSPDEPCYAGGWGSFADSYIAKIKSDLTSWPQKMTISGIKITSDMVSSIIGGGGNMALFQALAAKLIGSTHYQYYYNGQKSDAEVLSSHACNCYDGAELLIHLANRLGLPASMGHGNWGADGHVWAVIAGKIFDTTAYQHGYGWKSPKVTGYVGAGPSAGTNSKPSKIEINIHGNVYGDAAWKQTMEDTANEVFDKKMSGESGIGY